MAIIVAVPPLPLHFPFLLPFILAIHLSHPLSAQTVHHQLRPGEGERLKAELLASLNKYGGQRAQDGPLEPIGAPLPAALSPFPGLPELLAMLRPSTPTPPTTTQTTTKGQAALIGQKFKGIFSTANRRYQMPNGKRRETKQKAEEEKEWNRAANMVGDWRRKMYKMLKSIRRKDGGRKERGDHHQQQQQHRRHPKQQQPILLFGPPSLMDTKKADKLARLIGRRRKGGNNGTAEMKRGRKHLHSAELRMEEKGAAGGRRTASTRTKADDWDIYGDEPTMETEEDGTAGEEEQFEIVYVPALKRSGAGRRAEKEAEEGNGEEEELEGPTNGHQKHQLPANEPLPPIDEAPHILPSSFSPSSSSPLPPPSLSPSPPGLLHPIVPPFLPPPLQFPTLLPPLVTFTLPPALNPLTPPPPPPQSPSSTQSALNEKEYLRELENVPEDYVDEQEKRLPCLQRPSGAAESAAACKRTRSRPEPVPESAAIHQTAAALQDEQFPWDENREMCNSARLRSLIQQSIVPTSVEKSKRVLQQRAEAQFGAFYNVVCGTGFFSYIAHTDEFCLVAVQDVHCYVFSPVCASQLSIASGIAKQRMGMERQREKVKKMAGQKRHFLNRN